MTSSENRKKILRWGRRLGWAGIVFFTVKGLIWLAVFYGFGKLIGL